MKPVSPAGPAGLLTRIGDALASVRLAVVAMAALAVACMAATFYEARYGTPAAQAAFYNTAWFTALLALLGANVLFSMLKRWPWNRHHAGFVLAHVGILMLLGGSLVSLHGGFDGRLALQEGEGSSTVLAAGEALTVAWPGAPAVTLPDEALGSAEGERRFPLPEGGTLVVEHYRPNVNVGYSLAEGQEWNPALYFALKGAEVHEHGWLMARDEAASHADFGPVVFGFHAARTPAEARALRARLHDGNHLCYLLAPDGTLSYVIGTRKDATLKRGAVEIGAPVETPWMELTMSAERVLKAAERVRVVTHAQPGRGDDARRPAFKVRLEGAVTASSDWVVWGEPRVIDTSRGAVTVAYGPAQAPLPFRLTLLDFESQRYPGSDRPATYESRVRVDDPAGGRSEHLIAMNRPLHYGGYTFFQASYVEGVPMTSILSVSRSPGLPIVYLGTVLLSIGVVWMFYLKPLVARRQARRALRARAGGVGAAATA
jgi:hypothetical protein